MRTKATALKKVSPLVKKGSVLIKKGKFGILEGHNEKELIETGKYKTPNFYSWEIIEANTEFFKIENNGGN